MEETNAIIVFLHSVLQIHQRFLKASEKKLLGLLY